MTQFNFEAIGTKWQIDVYQDLDWLEEVNLLSVIKSRVEIFDKTYSRFRDDSLVTQISKEAGVYILPDDAQVMMNLYYDIYKRTHGLVTPLIGNAISDAGYDAEYSLIQKKDLEAPLPWEEVIEYNHPNLTITKPAILDFGAAGKGYLIDLVAEVLESNNIHSYCIDAGGDILHKNDTPIRVGLENPENTTEVIGVYELLNKSICGSAGNRRVWGKFTHIINPQTLTSPSNILAVWVVSKTAMITDMIATALFFVSASTLSDKYEFEYLIINSDHTIECSPSFSKSLFV